MNNVVLIGRLTADPEVSYTQSQKAMCRVTLAVDRMKEGADFIRVLVWDKQAENMGRYMHKGSKIAVLGRIETGSYKDRDGKTVYTTEVVAQRVEFLENRTNKPAEEVKEQAQDLFGSDVGFQYVDEGMLF